MTSTECRQVDIVLDGQGSLLSDEAMQHIDHCPQCRTLYDWVSEDRRSASISPALSRRIVQSLQIPASSVKPVLPRLGVLIAEFMALFVALGGGLTAILGTAGIARASLSQLIGVGVLLVAGMCLFSLLLGNQMRPGSYQPVPWQVTVAAVSLSLLTAMGVLFPWHAGARFVAQGLPCLLIGVSTALPTAALLWLAVRRGAPLSMVTTGATLGAAAGLLGMTVLQVKCPHQEAPHLLAWHGSVLVIASAAGVLLGWLAQCASDRKWISSSSNNEHRG